MARPEVQKVTLHGHELSFVDIGEGDVVLFVHGILGSERQWSHLVDRIDDDHRVVVPDLFGHGESAKPTGDYSLSSHAATLRDLLDHLGIGRVTLVGHSLGGGISMQFYYLFPDRVERLVLVASGGLGREVGIALRSATLPGAEQVLRVIASSPVLNRVEALGRSARRIGWQPGADVGAIWRGLATLGDRDSRRAFLATTRAVVDFGGQSISAHDHLRAATPPTMVVWGSNDRMIPAWHALNAQRSISDCRVELFEGVGHFPHLDDPERFAQVLRDFISTSRDSDATDAGEGAPT